MKKMYLFITALFVVLSIHHAAAECAPIDKTWLQTGQSDWGDMNTTDATIWSYRSSFGAYARKVGGGEAYLYTPSVDLSEVQYVNLAFEHTYNYASELMSEQILLVCAEFTGDVNTSSWQQITIPNYPAGTNWTYVSTSIDIPTDKVGSKTVFAFRYKSTSSANGTWEIKNLHLTATFPADCGGGTESKGRLKVCAQNLKHYYVNYGQTNNTDYHDVSGFNAKTNKIVNSFLLLNADIYAMCEVEAKPEVLQYIAGKMNERAGVEGRYAAVDDGIDYSFGDGYDNHIKSGFIYRTDKVAPVGANTAATTVNYYCNTMRIQAFKELETGERLVLSMNHFKSKVGEDDGEETREWNAEHLVKALRNVTADPDILIVGDLNCMLGETPLVTIMNDGYTEQLVRFNEAAYAYCYEYTPQLIDHAFANSTMSEQIADAYVYHNCTYKCTEGVYQSNSYSDHDPYVIEINLEGGVSEECQPISASHLATGGADWDLGQMTQTSLAGQYKWRYQSSYGATCQDNAGLDWLFTPGYEMSKAKTVTIAFDQALNNASTSNKPEEFSLWVTPDFSTLDGSSWSKLTIDNYPAGNNWTWLHTTIEVPTELVGTNTVFGFKYAIPEYSGYAPTWEIKNLVITATCDTGEGIEDVQGTDVPCTKMLRNGQLFILRGDKVFTVTGIEIR